MEAGTGRERSAASLAEGERKVRVPRSGSGSRSPSAIVGKRSPEQGGEAALRAAGRLLPAAARSAAAANPGGGDNQAAAGRRRRRRAARRAGGRAAPACGITRGPGGARGSRLPVKNVSHQRRSGTGCPHTAISSPRVRRSEGGGPAASHSVPPRRHGERRAIGARYGGPCPAPAAPIYNRRAAPAPLRLPAAGPSPAWRLCVCPRHERALGRPCGRPFPLAVPRALLSALPVFSPTSGYRFLFSCLPLLARVFFFRASFSATSASSSCSPIPRRASRFSQPLPGLAALPLLAGAFLPWSSLPPWASASPPKFTPRSLLPPFYFLCAFSVLCLLSPCMLSGFLLCTYF